MNTIGLDSKDKTFAALKLIEQLYLDHQISDTVYRNIILHYASPDNITCFKGFFGGENMTKGGNGHVRNV